MARKSKTGLLYSPEFRLEVLQYSDEHSPREAIDRFDLPKQTVHQWRHLRKTGQLRLPSGEAMEALKTKVETAMHKTRKTNGANGASKDFPRNTFPKGYKARVVAALLRGDHLEHVIEMNPDPNVDIGVLKEWRKAARLKKKHPGFFNAGGKLRPKHKRNLLPVPIAEAQVEEFVQRVSPTTVHGNGRDPLKMAARVEALEFLLAYLVH